MKKGVHPDYHFVTVQLNDGTSYRTRTTWGAPEGKLTLDIDPSTHPARPRWAAHALQQALRRFRKELRPESSIRLHRARGDIIAAPHRAVLW
jgi:large subunit ribosomal protein L31